MPRAASALPMTDNQRIALARIACYTTWPHREVVRAQALFAAADGVANVEIARRFGTSAVSVRVWKDAWDRFVPFLQFPPMAREVLYTTNSIESRSNELRKATKTRVQFTNDESAIKTLWLMICNIEDKRALKQAKQAKSTRSVASGRYVEGARVTNWKQAINQMIVAYPNRFERYL